MCSREASSSRSGLNNMNNQLPIDDERLSAFLDDELSREERTQIESLIEQREDYRAALDELRNVRAAMKSLPAVALSADFEDRVRTQVLAGSQAKSQQSGSESTREITPVRKGGFQSYIWPLAAIAALVLAMLTLPSILSSNRNVAKQDATKSSAVAESMGLDGATGVVAEQAEIQQESLEFDSNLAPSGDTDDKLDDLASDNEDKLRTSNSSAARESFSRMGRSLGPGEPATRSQPKSEAPLAAPALMAEDAANAGADGKKFNSFNLSEGADAELEEMTIDRADADSKDLADMNEAGMDEAGVAIESQGTETGEGGYGGGVVAASAPPQKNFSLGCDAVCEVNLKSQDQAMDFYRTLVSNNIQMNEAASPATVSGKQGSSELELVESDESRQRNEWVQQQSTNRDSRTDDDWQAAATLPKWAESKGANSQTLIVEAAATDVARIVSQLKGQSIEFNILTVAEPAVAAPAGGAGTGGASGGATTAWSAAPQIKTYGDTSVVGEPTAGGAVEKFGVANQVQLSSDDESTLNELKELRKSYLGKEARLYGQNFYFEEAVAESNANPTSRKFAGDDQGGQASQKPVMNAGKNPQSPQSQLAAVKQLVENAKKQQQAVVPQCRILITLNPPEPAVKK